MKKLIKALFNIFGTMRTQRNSELSYLDYQCGICISCIGLLHSDKAIYISLSFVSLCGVLILVLVSCTCLELHKFLLLLHLLSNLTHIHAHIPLCVLECVRKQTLPSVSSQGMLHVSSQTMLYVSSTMKRPSLGRDPRKGCSFSIFRVDS